jgi:DNA-binding PadR family transcriptional regulator
MTETDPIQSFVTELRRGSLTLAVLGCLTKPHYGYDLLQTLQSKGIDIEANTLYPLLRRLDGQKILTSHWDTTESRPRKYYAISEKGLPIYAELLDEWMKMQRSILHICGGDENSERRN